MDDYRYKALQTLTRARFDVIQNLTREKQRFANYLFLKCSGMAQDKDIQNTSATTIALMEQFETVDDLANANLDELTVFIDEKGRNFADPAAKAKAIRSAARDSPAAADTSPTGSVTAGSPLYNASATELPPPFLFGFTYRSMHSVTASASSCAPKHLLLAANNGYFFILSS